MRKLSDKEIKKSIFEILSAFADYCDEHELRYYLCGGTLLGAVRHQDFIPWDDDIDILMPRPDYMRLQHLLEQQSIAPHYQLKCVEKGNSLYPYGKIVDMRTKICSKFNHVDHALWIDLFPMDGIPDSIQKSNAILKKACRWKWMNVRAIYDMGAGTTRVRGILKMPLVFFLRMRERDYYAKRLNAMAKQYDFDDCDYVAGIAWSNGPRERMKKADFVPYEDKEFHGRMFHAPACWDFYLKAMYGDYMKLPPENKRYAHMIDAYWVEQTEERKDE